MRAWRASEPGTEQPAGIEIEVTPAGKATRRLSLLSGGEKALVALAFVFAVFLARPSPFYLLDEVEAALDDANIDRFLQLVRRFADRAQFVIVTHQKRTMDAADVLYGVSMGKGGVTKVISRRLSHPRLPRTRPKPPRQPEATTLTCRSMARTWRRSSTSAQARISPPPARGGVQQRGGLFRRLRESLSKSRQALQAEISASLFEQLDDETWERLEEALILADVGAKTTADVVGRLEHEVEAGSRRRRRCPASAPGGDARGGRGDRRRPRRSHRPPGLVMIVGVNGTGKTTTIGKLAWHLQRELGLSVIVAAADTYRAAAIEQLETWAERAGAEIVRGAPGGDPGAVLFDAISAAESRGADVVIADTAGRLHTHANLMEELAKVRESRREAAGRRPARVADRDRRHHGPERAAPGAGVRRSGRPHGRGPDEARWDREGRDRARDRVGTRPARQADRGGGGAGGPTALRSERVRVRAPRGLARAS